MGSEVTVEATVSARLGVQVVAVRPKGAARDPGPSLPSRPPSVTPGPATAGLPNTWDGIHLGLAFDYRIADPDTLNGKVGYVWGARRPHTAGVSNDYYATYARDYFMPRREELHTLDWWKANHPDWIVYQCDGVTPAFEFGDLNAVPLDITNPEVRSYEFEQVAKALDAGYQGIAWDNVNAQNYGRRCGTYRGGVWTRLGYEGSSAKFENDVIDWGRAMYGTIKAHYPDARVSVNSSPQSSGADFIERLAPYIDNVYDEEGSRGFGADWQQEVRALEYLANAGKGVVISGYPTSTVGAGGISPDVVEWLLANYLLIKGTQTFIYVYDEYATYGDFKDRPEYRAPIGHPTSARYLAGGVYRRDYSGGLVVVNPSAGPAVVPLPRAYYDVRGNPVTSVAVSPRSGAILLNTP
jgi:hypothetical protein